MKQKKQPKQRNPYVQQMLKRKSGAHQKSKKVERRDDKSKIRKEWLGRVAA